MSPQRPESASTARTPAAGSDERDEDGRVAPAVVAVVVAYQPGLWFEEALRTLARQDYPALSVLVIASGDGAERTTERVADVLPSAYVRRLAGNPGFSAAANEVLEVVEGAAFYLFLHDDVALAPDAVGVLVEEAFRSNAGVVGPKVVRWDDSRRLLEAGFSVDKAGVPAPLVERNELDQEQHDAVRDVFVVSTACQLVRADLFGQLEGFDAAMSFIGEDVDFCWRAQVVGARVMVAPAAVARHRESLADRQPPIDKVRLAARHRLRTVLTCYQRSHRLRILPQAFLLMVAETIFTTITGNFSHARSVAAAWPANLVHPRAIRKNRKRLNRMRQLPDSEVRRLQVRGSARVSAFLRGQLGTDQRRAPGLAATRSLADRLRDGSIAKLTAAVVAAVAVLVYGSRLYALGRFPGSFGDFPRFGGSPADLLRQWQAGWNRVGLGSEGAPPTALGLFGALGTILFGSADVARRVLMVAPLAAGAFGAWRLPRPTGSAQVQAVCLVAFLAVPVPYNAIATGRWGGLVLWAMSPWVLLILAGVAGTTPYEATARRLAAHVLALGFVTALAATAAPVAVLVVPVVAAALAVGMVLGGGRGATRTLLAGLAGSALAAVLHFPFALELLEGGHLWPITGVRSTQGVLSAAELLRFETGPLGAAPVGYVFIVVAALPLLVGRDWRLAWAVRAWAVALACLVLAWFSQLDGSPVPLATPEALLGPTAAALAFAMAMGMAAVQIDLPAYRFGWRQLASALAAVSLLVGAVPVLASSFNGRWNAPSRGLESLLGFLDDEQADVGPFRTLWVGDPDVLPLKSWSLVDGLAYATSDGLPTVAQQHPSGDVTTEATLGPLFDVLSRGETTRFGQILSPLGVRYLVVPEEPALTQRDQRPVPEELLDALEGQTDLLPVEVGPGVHVYRNTMWVPIRTVLPEGVTGELDERGYADSALASPLVPSDGPPVAALPDRDAAETYRGPLADDRDVYQADASSPRWHLEVDGQEVARRDGFGWANAYTVDGPGEAVLRFDPPASLRRNLGLQGAMWLLALVVLAAGRRPGAAARRAARRNPPEPELVV